MIEYIEGDITKPINDNPKIIPHICNTFGMWGKGVVIPIGNKWPIARETFLNTDNHVLGRVQFVAVDEGLYVANMIAQPYLIRAKRLTIDARYNQKEFDYAALETCLETVANYARPKGYEIHMPRIGTGLAAGDWELIEPIIEKTCKDLNVYVYDYNEDKPNA